MVGGGGGEEAEPTVVLRSADLPLMSQQTFQVVPLRLFPVLHSGRGLSQHGGHLRDANTVTVTNAHQEKSRPGYVPGRKSEEEGTSQIWTETAASTIEERRRTWLQTLEGKRSETQSVRGTRLS